MKRIWRSSWYQLLLKLKFLSLLLSSLKPQLSFRYPLLCPLPFLALLPLTIRVIPRHRGQLSGTPHTFQKSTIFLLLEKRSYQHGVTPVASESLEFSSFLLRLQERRLTSILRELQDLQLKVDHLVNTPQHWNRVLWQGLLSLSGLHLDSILCHRLEYFLHSWARHSLPEDSTIVILL